MGYPIESQTITAHLPAHLTERLDQLVTRSGHSKEWILQRALAVWIDQAEKHDRLTRAALADVDANRVIDPQLIQDWADSLSVDSPPRVPATGP